MVKILSTIVRYEWKSFLRNKFQLLMLVVAFVFGLYAIYYGQAEMGAQRRTIKAVLKLEQEEFEKYKCSFKAEMETLEQEQTHDIASKPAYAWYRHGYNATLPPHDYASLAIGQRDLFRYYYRLTGMSLHYQLFENELANPVNLLAGNFDLSFVLVYLFPLLIIAFCYGLFSSEKESGTLALLQIQSVSMRTIILVKLTFYFLLITGLALLLSCIGLVSSGSPLASANLMPAIAWLIGTVIYCAFWFSLLFLIISFKKSSSFNAITAACCWLLFLIVIPGLLNLMVTIKYPLNSAALAGITRRTSIENENDEKEAKAVIYEFLEHYPQLAGSNSLIHNDLLPKAYAAFTALKDIHHQPDVDRYNGQVVKRNTWTSQFDWLSPAVNMQNVMAHITKTDVDTFLGYQKALVAFHKNITDFYFTRLFGDKPILLEDYNKVPIFKVKEPENRWLVVWNGLIKMLIMTTFILAYSIIQARKL